MSGPCTARLAAPDGVVKMGLSGELADQAVDPSEDDLAAPQVAHSLDPQPQSLDLGQQRRRAQVDEMARQVEGKPAVPEGTGLKAGRIGHGDHQQSHLGRGALPHGSTHRTGRGGVFSSECQKMTAAQAPVISSISALRRFGPEAWGSRPTASRPWRAKASTRVPSPAPTSSTGPGGSVRCRRWASDARVRRSTASPRLANRPSAGRYQSPYASPSCVSLGHGDVVATPHRVHQILPVARLSAPSNW